MAGDWIKMRVNLTTHPKVLCIAELLLDTSEYQDWAGLAFSIGGVEFDDRSAVTAERHAALRITRYVTVTALLRFWGYANEHSKDGKIAHVARQDIDEVVGVPGFADALSAAGWADFDPMLGGLELPEFEKHNTSFESRTSGAAERQKRYRDRQKAERESAAVRDVTRDVTVTPREEKRREEKKENPQPPAGGSEGFEEFWNAYPRKVGKDAALKAFSKRKPDDALVAAMLRAVETQARSEAWRKDAGQFIPHPSTWLNEGRWQDEGVVLHAVPAPRPSGWIAEQEAHRKQVEAERMARLKKETA